MRRSVAPVSQSQLWLSAGILLLCTSLPSFAQKAEQDQSAEVDLPENYTEATYIIRPGDTFISITKELLGNARYWEANSRLNPGKEVRKLSPGARMKVLIDPDRVPLSARVKKRSGTVEAQPSPMSWLGAETNDLLIEKDAARTMRKSSAELEFHDGTSVVITEESIVFIRQLGRGLSTVPSNRTTQQVELLAGQADLSSLAGTNSGRQDVEVIMGGSTLRIPKESPIRTRTAIADTGASKVGVYEGDAQFDSSAGGTLELETGEGLVAAANEVPKKERLLEAPQLTGPTANQELVAGQESSASWTAPGERAVTYTLEVCRDRECGSLVQRDTGLTTLSQPLPDLPPGSYFWRATAASASGLDGYPSTPSPFTVVALPADSTPPEVALRLTSFGVPYEGLQAFGPNPPLETSMSDQGTGVERSGLMVNGKETALDHPLSTGPTRISLFAIDRARQRSETQIIEIFTDADAPTLEVQERPAPSLSKRTVKRPKSKRKLRRAKAKGASYPANAVFALSKAEPIGYSIDDIEWRPLASLDTGLLTDSTQLQLAVNDGYCLAGVDSQRTTGAGGACGRSYLTVTASDEHTGVKLLQARTEGTTLIVEARDEVGNVSELRFLITPDDGSSD